MVEYRQSEEKEITFEEFSKNLRSNTFLYEGEPFIITDFVEVIVDDGQSIIASDFSDDFQFPICVSLVDGDILVDIQKEDRVTPMSFVVMNKTD